MIVTGAQAASYVQFGCGFCAPQEWINFDASPAARFERMPLVGKLYTFNADRFPPNVRYGDICRGLPVADGSCRGLYASHVLEHLTLEDLRWALRESFRMLEPGGVLRVVVPDLELYARRYVSALDQGEVEACSNFMRRTGLGQGNRRMSPMRVLRDFIGGSHHRWMWDYPGLKGELEKVGFVDVRRAQFNDSEDEMFKLVEDQSRFVDACAVEARRPPSAVPAQASSKAA